MIVSVVVAVAENGVIGNENRLPWHLPADLKNFRGITLGHSVIMGRKTYQSLGKPLKERRNIVVSNSENFLAEGCEVVASLGDALKACIGEHEVFIIGGGMIFEKAFDLKLVDKVYVTIVHKHFDGDAFFSIPDAPEWIKVSLIRKEADEKNLMDYSFLVIEKRR